MFTKRRLVVRDGAFAANLVAACVAVAAICVTSGCSSQRQSAVEISQIERISLNMSEQDVVRLLGEPDRVVKKKYRAEDASPSRVLHYTLADGSKWVAVIDDQDKLVSAGSVESLMSRKSKKSMQTASR